MISIAEKVECLKFCPLFKGLSVTTLRLLAESMEVESFAKGEDVCVHGEEADRFYVVKEGVLGVFLPGEGEPIQKHEPGELFGEYGMFTGYRLSSVWALSSVVLLSLEYDRGRSFFLRHPDVIMEMLAMTAKRLERAEIRLQKFREEVRGHQAEKR